MNNVNNFNSLKNKRLNQGFTLMELIIVIIILGILSVTVAPKFFTAKGFSEYGYRTDVIAKLRLIQLKAMQQTQAGNSECHRVLLTTKKLSTPDGCASSEDSATKVQIADQDNVTFSSNITGNSFVFDSMGRPSCTAADCKITGNGDGEQAITGNGDGEQAITITITGELAIGVQIKSEGYIHAL